MKALIIGGGIAGPVAAVALQKAGIESAIYDSREADQGMEGAFLNLAPNGINALAAVGLAEGVKTAGFHSDYLQFYNKAGKEIGRIDSSAEQTQFGAENMMLKRHDLHVALASQAQEAGIPFHYGKRLESVAEDASGVAVHFEDGTSARGDILLGCDGLRSKTRAFVAPGASLRYTGIIDCGGFAPTSMASTNGQNFVFGDKAFFGYLVSPNKQAFWFSNMAQSTEPSRAELANIDSEKWMTQLRGTHARDPHPVREILASAERSMGVWPVYDLPTLPRWHSERICLVGDAAHATSPHIGQGASLAIEDAVFVAKCLRDHVQPAVAFEIYESHRRGRVERLVKQAKRTGDRKIPNPVTSFVRDLMLPMFLKAGAKINADAYAYKIDW
jgi:FAD-dependent urate hydroxylase